MYYPLQICVCTFFLYYPYDFWRSRNLFLRNNCKANDQSTLVPDDTPIDTLIKKELFREEVNINRKDHHLGSGLAPRGTAVVQTLIDWYFFRLTRSCFLLIQQFITWCTNTVHGTLLTTEAQGLDLYWNYDWVKLCTWRRDRPWIWREGIKAQRYVSLGLGTLTCTCGVVIVSSWRFPECWECDTGCVQSEESDDRTYSLESQQIVLLHRWTQEEHRSEKHCIQQNLTTRDLVCLLQRMRLSLCYMMVKMR